VRHPTGLIVLNRPSLDAFEPRVRAGGVVAINDSRADLHALNREAFQKVMIRGKERQ
jgi:hypothetical protein